MEDVSGKAIGWVPDEEPKGPRSANEKFYDREIAKAIRTIARKCNGRGMSFLAIVECDSESARREVTRTIGERISVPMTVINLAADAGSNIDKFAMDVRDLVSKHDIQHQSAILRALGLDPDPEKRPKAGADTTH